MEEKDISGIAGAVAKEIAKLNADKETSEGKEEEEETFKCPDCNVPVKGGIAYCQACGCSLEWGE